MIRSKLGPLALVVFFNAAAPVFAESPAQPSAAPAAARSDRFDERYARHMERIDRGAKSGELTDREAARLREREARLKQMHAKMAADGKISREERREMRHAMERQSKAIARERHDRQHDLDHDGKIDRPRSEHGPASGGAPGARSRDGAATRGHRSARG